MQKFQDTFETRKRSFIDAFFNCMTVNLNMKDCRAISIKTLYKVGIFDDQQRWEFLKF